MATQSPEAEPQAATALIAHLRERPEDARRSPADLAAQFGLSPQFVKSVLASAGPHTRREGQHFQLVLDLSSVRRAVKKLSDAFDRVSAEPMVFVAWTTLMCVSICALAELIDSIPRAHLGTLATALQYAAVAVTVVLQMTCYFRRGMMRYSLHGGLFIWVIVAIVFIIWNFHEQHRASDLALLGHQLGIILATLMVGAVYSGLGALVTLLGSWTRLKIEERQDEKMSRQELLERYFELQGRLERSETSGLDEPLWSHWRLVRAFHRSPLFFSFSVGFVASLPAALVWCLAVTGAPTAGRATLQLYVLLQCTCTLLLVPVYIFLGFFSRGLRESLLNTVIGRVAALVTLAIPFALSIDLPWNWFVFNTCLLIPLGLLSQVGAKMERNLMRSESLKHNDQAAIVAEMLRIQWRLSDHPTVVCVLSVDAARSSQMKSQADPLAVEFSFREYQHWIEAICGAFGGRVHSTAGDGAVVAFRDCRNAFQAARRLQTDLARFNREDNRLPVPFRLRIGLHVGQVAGELDEVVFTEVIDIAAHVQAVAPISGIAATDDVATEVGSDEFVPLTKTVDGHGVMLALNPIED